MSETRDYLHRCRLNSIFVSSRSQILRSSIDISLSKRSKKDLQQRDRWQYAIKFSRSFACRFQFRVINERELATEWQIEKEWKKNRWKEAGDKRIQIRF